MVQRSKRDLAMVCQFGSSKNYAIANDDDIIRLDILYGTKVLYPEMACVLLG